ncbi:prepilin peptidase [Sterolibacterium denitrificans]|uniref:Replication restart protein PriB n=1 Tax=Sterolibacterium denitrificans TaxID=157592 RepID=A0A656ZCY5_9PROT|nr:prepilin peptidase [Sterolibacterium denitrificans]
MLTGRLLELSALRYTPAGVPVLGFRIAHSSQQSEADVERAVGCEISAVALGPNAQLMAGAKPGEAVRLTGFLAAKSLKSRSLILHVNEIEFLEGNQNGI